MKPNSFKYCYNSINKEKFHPFSNSLSVDIRKQIAEFLFPGDPCFFVNVCEVVFDGLLGNAEHIRDTPV